MSKQFLRGCLAYEERNRWSWQKIFSERIFSSPLANVQSSTPHIEVNQLARRFITNIQQIVV